MFIVQCQMWILSVPENGPALLGLLDIEVLNILKITCEVVGDPYESRKFNSQTI